MRKHTQKNFNNKPVSRKYAVSGEPGAGMVLYALDPAGHVWDIVFGQDINVDLAWVIDDATLNSVPQWRFDGLDDRGNNWSGVIAPTSGNPDNLIVTELTSHNAAELQTSMAG